jgi:hypothetical protein
MRAAGAGEESIPFMAIILQETELTTRKRNIASVLEARDYASDVYNRAYLMSRALFHWTGAYSWVGPRYFFALLRFRSRRSYLLAFTSLFLLTS